LLTRKLSWPTSIFWVVISAFFITIFANFTMFEKANTWLIGSASNQLFIVVLVLFQFLLLLFFMALLTMHKWHRHVLAVFYFVAAFSAYFADSYGVIIDKDMLINAAETNVAEALGLLSWRLLFYFTFLFALPSFVIYKVKIIQQSARKRILDHFIVALLAIVCFALILLASSNFSTSFFREQKQIPRYSNPLSALYASYKITHTTFFSSHKLFKHIGDDAHISGLHKDRELIILVIGETARADHFSLNGYKKNTNPMLSKQSVVSFNNVSSCGTSTRVSVPCMFAIEGKDKFELSKFKDEENFLDVAKKSGVNILWRDNNSSSKGVADRFIYEDFLAPRNNPICDPECRDIGMLSGLDEYINKQKKDDIIIILHQMGSHGPAYYERVPESFRKFKPFCKTNQLDQCTDEEISNAYDNTILYTDFFLSEVIDFLKKYDDRFETAMFYVSDHGESLGEHNIYLHGMPYFMAPKGVTNVPLILWFGKNFIQTENLDMDLLKLKSNKPISHDNVFHTLLGILEIETGIYKKEKDLKSLAIKK
jgi:lipid A ethanolaminephosphotransferase